MEYRVFCLFLKKELVCKRLVWGEFNFDFFVFKKKEEEKKMELWCRVICFFWVFCFSNIFEVISLINFIVYESVY